VWLGWPVVFLAGVAGGGGWERLLRHWRGVGSVCSLVVRIDERGGGRGRLWWACLAEVGSLLARCGERGCGCRLGWVGVAGC